MIKSILKRLKKKKKSTISLGEIVDVLNLSGIPFELQGLWFGTARLYVEDNLICSKFQSLKGPKITAWLTFKNPTSFDTDADLPLKEEEVTKLEFIKYCNEYIARKLRKGGRNEG